MTDRPHPAPHRHAVSFALLVLALVATPCLWGVRLVTNYALDSHFCFPGDARRNAVPGWVWPTLLGIDVLVLLLAVAATLISYRNYQATRTELAAPCAPLIEIGEGRTRFLALWGLMIGVGFVVAMLFDLVALWVVPACG